jgi:hypothetical protein
MTHILSAGTYGLKKDADTYVTSDCEQSMHFHQDRRHTSASGARNAGQACR